MTDTIQTKQTRSRAPQLAMKPPAFGDAERYIEAYDLQPFVPKFTKVGDQFRVLDAARTLPNVKDVSFSDPEVVSIYFNSYGGAEPALEFRSFTKGVAAGAFIIREDQRDRLPQAIETLAAAVMDGAQIPPINDEFQERIQHVVEAIFSNNEPVSWRPLLAFTNGVFWMLGFLKEPFVKTENQITPVTWCQALCERYAALGHLPQ